MAPLQEVTMANAANGGSQGMRVGSGWKMTSRVARICYILFILGVFVPSELGCVCLS